ncbi:MAG: OmpA family protein, partial [Chitinophagaceae bacterium]
MRKWFYISFFFIQHLLGHAYAQTTAVKPKPISQNLRAIQLQAEREYKASHFETAITLYKSYFKRINFIDTTAVFNVAESYRLSKQFDSAMVYFQKLSNWHPRYLPNLAELYATVGNYSKSIETYKSIVPTDSNQLKKIEARIIGFKGREDFQIDSLDWKLTSSKINSNGNESNPVRYKDGIAYTAAPISRKNGAVDQAQPVLLYAPDSIATSPSVAKIDSTKNKKQIKQPKKRIAIDITSRNSIDNSTLRKPVAKPKPVVREEVSSIDPFLQKIISGGPIQFSITGDTVYYAQSVRLKDKKSKLGIFYAVKSNNQWKEKDEITAGYTSSTFHPSASKDGRKIYFVIDSKDGFGGPDLYFVERMGDTAWSSPTNAGPYVNSPGNELFPTIIGDSLYFSTNGRGGLGGQDIFVVQLDKNEVPTNLGFPINSSYDDYGIVFNDARSGGYVSSNRNGSGDIYAFNFKKVFYRTGGTINYASDNTIASREQVYLVDTKTEKTVDSTITDDLGNYYFNLRPNRLYRIEQREDGLSKGSYVVNTKEPVYLDSTLLAKRIQTDSAAVVVAESQPVDTAAVAILQRIADIDSLVVLEKDLITTKLAIQQLQKDSLLLTQQSSTIDTVSTETASTVVRKMLIQSQLRELKSDLSRLEYKKFELSLALQPPKDIVQINSTKPVEKIKINIQLPGVSPKQKADSIAYVIQQRLIKQKEEEELLLRGDQLTRFNVYFGFSKFNLNLIEQKILDSTIKVLKANPNLFAVMGSFTDCSGPIDFNIRLSAKRSAAVIKYLIQNGVDKSRIRENHYGKNYLVQNCSPKRYSSRQQLLNRRTEIYLTNDKSLAWTDLAADTTKKYSVYTALGKKLSDFVSLKTVYVTAKKLKVDSSQLIVKAKGQERREKGEEKQPVAQPITKNLQPTTVKQDSVLIVKDQPKPALQKQIVKKDTTVSIVKKVPEVKKDSVVIVKAQPSTV